MPETIPVYEPGVAGQKARAARPTWAAVVIFLLLAVLFAVVYTQAPLFTSNQNQYFLHGLADAGYGTLSGDWLAGTLDPTPVFSALIEFNYRLFQTNATSYLWYALLMGVYFYSLLRIVGSLVDVWSTPVRRWSFLALVLLLHSAALRFVLARALGDNWTFVLEDGVADQRLLGLVYQPSAFGVFLLLSIALYLKKRPYLAVLSAVLAATVHPTYLLSAAALTAAYMLAALLERQEGDARRLQLRGPNLRRALGIGLLALLAVMPILVYALVNLSGSGSAYAERAREILVDFRIPHHAVVAWWWDATAALKVLIVSAALVLVRRTRLFIVLLAPALTAVGLTLVQLALDSNMLALVFPWRISTWLVPLSSTLLLGYGLVWLLGRFPALEGSYGRWLVAGSAALIAGLVLVGGARLYLDFSRKASDPARPMYSYVAQTRQPGEVYLTPIKMQDFRLEAGAPAFVDFKSIPYHPDDVLVWYERVQLADRFYERGQCDLLDDFQTQGVSHVVVERAEFAGECPGLARAYQDENYAVFRIAKGD